MPSDLRISIPNTTHATSNTPPAPASATPKTPKTSQASPQAGPLADLKAMSPPRSPQRSQTLPLPGGARAAASHSAEAPGQLETGRAPTPLAGPPLSPRTTANRLFKVANADPKSTVTDGLGAKSQCLPNLKMQEGGGFNVTTKEKRKPTPSEIESDFKAKQEKFNAAQNQSKRQPPQPLDPNKDKTFFEAGLEYHPPGGVHSNYPGTVDHDKGGSYLRARYQVPQGGEQRYGREGPFAGTETFDHKPLKARPKVVANPLAPPNPSNSPPPSPTTAASIMEGVYREPQRAMQELATGKPYRDVAAALNETPPATDKT